MKNKVWALAGVFAVSAAAQVGGYLGPAVLSRGAGAIGTRAGQQVNLRFTANVSGFYETGILPFGVDSTGKLLDVSGQTGVEASLGVYGVHQWQHSLLGVDYQGDYRHYDVSQFDGSDQKLSLGFTHQKSRRLVFDLRQLAGTLSRGISSLGGYTPVTGSVVDQTALLYDSRATYLQSTMDVSFLKSARTIYTFGGDGYTVRRRAASLAGVNGYALHGSINHRVNRETTVGVSFEHSHYDFPKAFGEADINAYQLTYGRQFGRYWTFSVNGGIFTAEVQGLQRISLDPAVAALLGTSSGVQAFYRQDIFPAASASLGRRFKTAMLSFSYTRGVSPGNGVYLTSREETAGATLSYTGIRKWSFSGSGGYSTLNSLGQDIQGYRLFNGGAGLTYAMTRSLHATARYDARHSEIETANGFLRNSYRVTFGLSFSPGDVPLSLW